MRAAVAVISDGFGQALVASRLIRNASLYVGLLFILLAGSGVFAELGVLSWSDEPSFRNGPATSAAADAAGRAVTILVIGAVSCLVLVIDATAVGMTLLGSRLIGRPVTLRSAIQRARQVFWRLLGGNLVVGVAGLIGTAIYHLAIGVRPETIGGVTSFRVDPMVGIVISIPFVLTTAGIVIADDSLGDALRRSVRLARRSLPIAIALALFGFAFSFIGGLAINQGSGIVLSIAEAIHLDIASGGVSFLVGVVVGLAILSAFGSILFTVGSVIASAQATAFVRFGMPTRGLDRVTSAGSEPATEPPLLLEVPSVAEGEIGAARAEQSASSGDRIPSSEPTPGEPREGPALDAAVALDAPVAAPALEAAATPPRNPWEAWAERQEPANPRGTRWISIPMRALAGFLWLVAIVGIVAGPPH